MINLLPEEEKQKLRFVNDKKLTIVLGMVVLISLICLVLVLLSIKFYVLAETNEQKNVLEQAKKEYQTPELTNSYAVIKKYNGILTQVGGFYGKEVYFGKALRLVDALSVTKNINFTELSLNRDSKGLVFATISGVSDSRADLLLFKKNVEKNAEIKKPNFSQESWVNPENANFSLTFEIVK